jgi:hypothetical protein
MSYGVVKIRPQAMESAIDRGGGRALRVVLIVGIVVTVADQRVAHIAAVAAQFHPIQ